jgi:thiamine biosynthesis lipoprotein
MSDTSFDGRIRHVEYVMGTAMSFDIRVRDVPDVTSGIREAMIEAMNRLHRVDALFSTYRESSQVIRLARGELRLAQCDPLLWDVMRLCEEAHARTDGWFSAYHNGFFDPTGLVKGWAVERAARMIMEAGASAVCANGGGDIQLFGGPWRIGISDPLAPGEVVAIVDSDSELAIATSGPAERGCHILDPRTHRPPSTSLVSFSVVARKLTDADVLATAGYAMGDQAPSWFSVVPDVGAFAVLADHTTWHNANFVPHAVGIRA